MKRGIDVSKHNGVLNWDKLKATGQVDFAMLRAVSTTTTGLYKDPTFERNYKECKRLGIPCGVYYFSYALNQAQAGAELNLLFSCLAGKQFEYPICYDLEDGSQRPLSTAALTSLAAYTLTEIQKRGFYTMLYTYFYFAVNELDLAKLAAYDLWLADYRGTRPTMPHGIWQYTSSGLLDGCTTRLDKNYAYKDYPAIIKAAYLNGFKKPQTFFNFESGLISAGDKDKFVNLANSLKLTAYKITEKEV